MRITEKDLKPGDVLLYCSNTWIAWFIKRFDGTSVSHAGLYLGNGRVGEALFRGIVENPLSDSIQGCEWVKAVRHSASDNGDDMNPVRRKAKEVLAQGERYAFEQILLLALVCSTRKIDYGTNPWLKKIAQKAITGAASLMDRFRNENKEPMICSEFVYRSFDEAMSDDNRYAIQLGLHEEEEVGAAAPRLKRRGRLRKRSKQNDPSTCWPIERGSLLDSQHDELSTFSMAKSEDSVESMVNELEGLIQQYADEKNNEGQEFECGAASDDEEISVVELQQMAHLFKDLLAESDMLCAASSSDSAQQVIADFVTPGDLLMSPSFREVGDLIP